MKKFFVIIGLLVVSLFIIGCGTGKALYGAAPLCGNNRLDAKEECDSPPDNSGYFTKYCNDFRDDKGNQLFDGGRIACTSKCRLNTSKCNPKVVQEAPVPKIGPTCGNNQLDPGEECDSPPDNSGFFNNSCVGLGYNGGRIGCSACKLNTAQCGPKFICEPYKWYCADGKIGQPLREQCDSSGTVLDTPIACPDGYLCDFSDTEDNYGRKYGLCSVKKPAPEGNVTCSEGWICQSPYAKIYQYKNCTLGSDSVYCANGCLNGECKSQCGNNIIEVGEECDGTNFAGKKCSDFIYAGTGKPYQNSNFIGRNLTCDPKLCTIDDTRCLKPSCEQIYGSGYICYHTVNDVPESAKGSAHEIGCDLVGKENWYPDTDLKVVQGDMCAPSVS